jgi:integrase/recombinase XerD
MLAAKGHDLAAQEATLTDRAIAYLIKSYCDKTFGKGHGIHPHSLRHTAAKAAEVNGATLTDIGDLLGHASTRVTSVYMHATRKAADKTAARLGDRYATPTA